MRVDWAIPCRYAEVQPQGGMTIVGAGADLSVIPSAPAAVPILFAVRFVGDPEELDGQTPHPIRCRIFNPAGEQVGEQSVAMTTEVTQVVPGYVAEVLLPVGVVLAVGDYGTYSVEFQIDDTEPRRVPLHILRAE